MLQASQQGERSEGLSVDMDDFVELNPDQRREKVNSDQRYQALLNARGALAGYRGSLVWHGSDGSQRLMRSYYDRSGARRQKTLGARSPQTEALKAEWEQRRAQAVQVFAERRETMERQAAINRALRLGRVPLIAAKIIRALDEAGLLGAGIRVAGTNAVYAYEAAAGVFVDAGVTATQDIDLLMDARRTLRILSSEDVPEGALLNLLRQVDRSFERTRETFRAINRDGYLIDLIKPDPRPPWKMERDRIGSGEDDLVAASMEGLAWLENARPFEAIAIDEKGWPVRMVCPDPRVFAAHKLWLSGRVDRDPPKRRRDEAQAAVVGRLTAAYLTHLPYEGDDLRVLPKSVRQSAEPLFRHSQSTFP